GHPGVGQPAGPDRPDSQAPDGAGLQDAGGVARAAPRPVDDDHGRGVPPGHARPDASRRTRESRGSQGIMPLVSPRLALLNLALLAVAGYFGVELMRELAAPR